MWYWVISQDDLIIFEIRTMSLSTILLSVKACQINTLHILITFRSPSAGKLIQFVVEDGGHVFQGEAYAEIEVSISHKSGVRRRVHRLMDASRFSSLDILKFSRICFEISLIKGIVSRSYFDS